MTDAAPIRGFCPYCSHSGSYIGEKHDRNCPMAVLTDIVSHAPRTVAMSPALAAPYTPPSIPMQPDWDLYAEFAAQHRRIPLLAPGEELKMTTTNQKPQPYDAFRDNLLEGIAKAVGVSSANMNADWKARSQVHTPPMWDEDVKADLLSYKYAMMQAYPLKIMHPTATYIVQDANGYDHSFPRPLGRKFEIRMEALLRSDDPRQVKRGKRMAARWFKVTLG